MSDQPAITVPGELFDRIMQILGEMPARTVYQVLRDVESNARPAGDTGGDPPDNDR